MLYQQPAATTAVAILQRSRLSLHFSSSMSSTATLPSSQNTPTTETAARQPAAQQSHSQSTMSQSRRNEHGYDQDQDPDRSQDAQGIQPKTFPGAGYFPLGYKDAAYQWWTSITPVMAEKNVMSFVPYIKEAAEASSETPATSGDRDPYGTRTWKRSLIQLPGKNRAINEVCIERQGEEVEDTLVMLHGYGSGLGLFYRNLEPITRVPGLKLYALDLLGMGNSSRPPFKMKAKTRKEQVIEAENWFVDALEEWRAAKKIERFTLLGHSLGGYLAVSYATRYPGHLKKLILASPVGVPENPYAVDESLPEPTESTLHNEVTQDQESITKTAKQEQPPKRKFPGWFVWLWDANVSPFTFVRNAGPLGPRFVSAWTSRRFNHLPTDQAQALHEYCFTIFSQKGSGEYALGRILAPGAYARRPIINRIQEVGRQTITKPDGTTTKETGIPIVFMYGDSDWMDVTGGYEAAKKLKERKVQALLEGTKEEKLRENSSVQVVVVDKAGHNLFLDNPDGFNERVVEELMNTKKADQARR